MNFRTLTTTARAGRGRSAAALAIACLSLLAPSACAEAPATDEILHILPSDVGACLVIEDFAHYYDLFAGSKLAERIQALDSVRQWKSSSTYKSFEQLVASLPAYFGVPNSELVRDIFGRSVVLAFRPPTDSQPPTGILLCNASNEEKLRKVVDRISQPSGFRKVTAHQHRGVDYVERLEFNARHDFLVRIGRIVAISDKEDAIETIIDVSLDGGSLYDSSEFRDMRAAVGEGAVAQLLLSTCALKPLLQRAIDESGSAGHAVSAVLADSWEALDWVAVSLRIGDPLELSLFASLDRTQLHERQRIWPELFAQPSSFWASVPSDALAAVATRIDFVALTDWLHGLAAQVPEIKDVLEAASGMVKGLSVDELLGRMGPEVGAVARVAPNGDMQIVAEIEIQSESAPPLVGLPLPEAIELVALRPMLLFYSLDRNRQFDDVTSVTTHEVAGLRMHTLTGSRWLPAWLAPTIAVSDGRIYLGSSPEAITARLSPPSESFLDSAAAKRIRQSLGENAVLKGFLDIAKLRTYASSHQRELASEIAERIPKEEGAVSQRIDDVSSILGLIDYVTLSTSTTGNVRKWTLAVFPSP